MTPRCATPPLTATREAAPAPKRAFVRGDSGLDAPVPLRVLPPPPPPGPFQWVMPGHCLPPPPPPPASGGETLGAGAGSSSMAAGPGGQTPGVAATGGQTPAPLRVHIYVNGWALFGLTVQGKRSAVACSLVDNPKNIYRMSTDQLSRAMGDAMAEAQLLVLAHFCFRICLPFSCFLILLACIYPSFPSWSLRSA